MKNQEFSPPVLLLLNVSVDAAHMLPHGISVGPIQSMQDETLFAELSNSGPLGELVSSDQVRNMAVAYCPASTAEDARARLRRLRLLLSLHPDVFRFSPALVQSAMLQFIRGRDRRSNDVVLLENQHASRDRVKAVILAGALAATQELSSSNWEFKDFITARDYGDDFDLFALTLQHFVPLGAEPFERALVRFSAGVSIIRSTQLDREECYGLAQSLITSAFEALFPISGKDKVVAQFKTVGGLLVPVPEAQGLFDSWYALRSTEFHGGDPTKEDRGASRIRPRIVRDMELAKFLFQLCTVQLMMLGAFDAGAILGGSNKTAQNEGDPSDWMDALLTAKTVWLNRIRNRLKIDNKWICEQLDSNDWRALIKLNAQFNPYDVTADEKLFGAGLSLCRLFCDEFGESGASPKLEKIEEEYTHDPATAVGGLCSLIIGITQPASFDKVGETLLSYCGFELIFSWTHAAEALRQRIILHRRGE